MSIGICTHAFYEAITHVVKRNLYGMYVTDFPHIRQLFVDAYTHLVATKLFALRAGDYIRTTSPKDRHECITGFATLILTLFEATFVGRNPAANYEQHLILG